MRHLLDVLRKELEEPTDISTSGAELEKKEYDLFDSLLPHLKSGGSKVKTKEDSDLISYASLIKYCDSPDYTNALSACTSVCSPDRTASPTKTNEKDEEGDDQEKHVGSPWLSEQVINYTGISEDDFQLHTPATNGNEVSNENHEYATVTSDEGFHQDQAEVNYDGQSKELEDLGRSLSESLHVSSSTHDDNVDTANEQHVDPAASASDDEF